MAKNSGASGYLRAEESRTQSSITVFLNVSAKICVESPSVFFRHSLSFCLLASLTDWNMRLK